MYKGKYEQNQAPVAPNATRVTKHLEATETPASTPAPRRNPNRKPGSKAAVKKGTTKGSYVFYGIYLAMVIVFFIVVTVAMGALKDFLIGFQADHEAKNPEYISQQVFHQYFSNPNWGSIYELAEPEKATDAAKLAYTEYMQELVGSGKLSCYDYPSKDDNVKKYIVLSDKTAVALFSLVADDINADDPNWRLGDLNVYFSYIYNLTYSIVTQPDCVVTVNGEVLDESDIISTVSTKVENYLPEGVHGYRIQEYQVSGLSAAPEIKVVDGNGAAVEMAFDEATNTYTQVLPTTPTIAQDQYDVVLAASKALTEYMIKNVGTTTLKKYFPAGSKVYNTIMSYDVLVRQTQFYKSHKFNPESITEFYQYSDTLFSARAQLVTEVNRTDNTTKTHEIDSTFIFTKTNGKWVVYDMINEEVQTQVQQVRLTFKDADGNVLSSDMVTADARSITTPAVTVPEGKVLCWYMETIDSQGQVTLTPAFQPDAAGNVNLAGRTDPLSPMTLVPQYTDAKEEG